MHFLKLIFLLKFYVYITNCALPDVTVRKCCGLNGYMTKFANYTYGCVNNTTKLDDYLRIYYIKKGFVSEFPSNWKVIKSKPDCENPKITVQSPIVIFANGSLFAIDSTLIHPDKYCYDYKLTYTCTDEPHKPILRKCCGENAIFSETNRTCIHMNVNDYKINVDTGKYKLVDGFPPCENDMSILEKFDAKKLTENGTLKLDSNKVLQEDTFCIEHILEKAGT